MNLSIRDLLAPQGLIARKLGQYEERPQQLQLCQAVEQALAQGRNLLAEAGTGVGKSFAYLLPAILHANTHRDDGPIVISTRTIGLQQQLEQKDLPFLQSVLPLEWSAVTAVGRNNYLCLRRMHLAQRERGLLFQDPHRQEQLQSLVDWSLTTMEGTRMDLAQGVDAQVWEEVQAEHGNCLHKACKYYEPCHYQRSRRRMQSADLLVVNHSLYMADLALRMTGTKYLPSHKVVIFDEAHHLERVATESLGLRLTPSTVEWHLRRLQPKKSREGLLSRYGTARAKDLVGQVRLEAEGWFRELQAQLAKNQGDNLELGDRKLSQSLSQLMLELAKELKQCSTDIEEVDRRTELQARARGFESLEAAIRKLCSAADANMVRWLEQDKRGPVLRSAPLDVSQALQSHLFDQEHTAVLVSATLDPGSQDFAWCKEQLGIQNADSLRLGSPFRYDDQVELVLEEALPNPAVDPQGFQRESKQRILEHILQNHGRALVLCTSWKFTSELAAFLRPSLELEGLRLLVQGEAPLVQLLREKRQDETSVLIGTDSLWEGIDLPGDALTLLIITRFPFAMPNHPLTKARVRAIEEQGGSGFFDHALPQAILKFRQGFGRLVRKGSDRGKVVLLDPRVRTKAYGRRFLAALPEGVQPGPQD